VLPARGGVPTPASGVGHGRRGVFPPPRRDAIPSGGVLAPWRGVFPAAAGVLHESSGVPPHFEE